MLQSRPTGVPCIIDATSAGVPPMLNIYADQLGQKRRLTLAGIVAATLCSVGTPAWAAKPGSKTPIEHLIVIVGENQTFDGLFATYVPKPGASVRNLLSQGIVDGAGNPGPFFATVAQSKATAQSAYTLDPPRAAPYTTLPQPRLIGVTDQNF